MLIKYPTLLLLMLLALGGCDGENENGGTIKPTCVPNGELPDSQCLAEDLFNSCDLNFCGTSFPDIFVDFFFPNQLDRTD